MDPSRHIIPAFSARSLSRQKQTISPQDLQIQTLFQRMLMSLIQSVFSIFFSAPVQSQAIRNAKLIDDPETQKEIISAIGETRIRAAGAASGLAKKALHKPLDLEGVEKYYEIRSTKDYGTAYAGELNKEIEHQLERDRLPSHIKPPSNAEIEGEKAFLKQKKPHVRGVDWSDPELNTIAMPTNDGLTLLAAYYTLKYQTPILVVNDSNFDAALEGKGLPEGTSAWGVIRLNKGTKHVNPVLCFKKGSEIQRLNLDSISEVIKYKSSDIPATMPRQSDPYSCRTDALVVLRDAIKDLKSHAITDLYDYLRPDKIENSTFYYLPMSWGRTAQKSSSFRPDAKASEFTVPSKKGKNKTLKEHRDIHKKPAILTTKMSVNSSFLFVLEGEKKEELSVNTYLNYKGKKNLSLIKKISTSWMAVDGINKSEINKLYQKLKTMQ